MNMNFKFKKALLDGGLVFIGIFLALILENYFADIELNNKQNRLLEELIVDLDETISDIANDMQSYNEYVDLTTNVINILNQEYSDSIISRASNEITLAESAEICANYAFVVPKKSTYESIKSLGIDLIEDDVLRTQISSFYELTLDRISTAESRVYDFTERECWPYIFQNFEWTSPLNLSNRDVRFGPDDYVMDWIDFIGLRAINYDELLTDQYFKFLLGQIFLRRSWTLVHYRRGHEEATQIKANILKYLDQGK
jgi:hypothetical protein